MAEKGAQAALRGYRLQALYILWCMLGEKDPDVAFQPEGSEDLSIFQGKKLIKSIQIKAHTANLSLSSFSPQNENSFFHRCAKFKHRPHVQISVASFGGIGQEINRAWKGPGNERHAITEKMFGYGFVNDDIEFLFANLSWEAVTEDTIKVEVFAQLNKAITAGDPESAFDLLTYWIYTASENRSQITRQDLIDKINQVGQYLAHRSTHYSEWFRNIKPLEEQKVSLEIKDKLAEEFRAGVSARYEHICANLDVVREDKLSEINKAFADGAKTVIVHGASGQGKTALALRYFKDYLPEKWRYSVQFVRGRQHAAQVATAIAGHMQAFGTPLYLHLDVSSADQEWDGLIKDLVSELNIKILVSIRQEDLARTNLREYEHGSLATVDLSFDRHEAQGLYQLMYSDSVEVPYPSFDESWQRFGGQGPLMEYVYFLTHTETLGKRLESQVRRLRDEIIKGVFSKEELAFLRICAVATAYQARIKLRSLADWLDLADAARTLELLEKEYLLRRSEDGHLIEAMHPIRSEILADILTDPTLSPWLESSLNAIAHMPESDLETFLLFTFSRRYDDSDAFLKSLLKQFPITWTGFAGVSKAILWLGIKRYLVENWDVITKAREIASDAAILVLDADLAQAMPPGSLNTMSLS